MPDVDKLTDEELRAHLKQCIVNRFGGQVIYLAATIGEHDGVGVTYTVIVTFAEPVDRSWVGFTHVSKSDPDVHPDPTSKRDQHVHEYHHTPGDWNDYCYCGDYVRHYSTHNH